VEEEKMKNKTEPTIDQLESKLSGWEKWLYAGFGAAFIMLLHSFVKAYENTKLVSAFFYIEKQVRTPSWPGYNEYLGNIFFGMHSPLRDEFGVAVVIMFIAVAAILAFSKKWRKIQLSKRLDLIFGFLLAGWIVLLSLGVQNSFSVEGGYNVILIIYILSLGSGYWWLRRKNDKAEEVFP
jgi:hypothetical protein